METQPTSPQLDLNDIVLVLNVIHTCSKRGAFEPAEFTVVGALFEKLKGFLPPEPQEDASESQETETTEAVNSGETNVLAVDFSEAKA